MRNKANIVQPLVDTLIVDLSVCNLFQPSASLVADEGLSILISLRNFLNVSMKPSSFYPRRFSTITEVYTIIFLPHSEASSHELLSLRGTFRLTLNLSAPFDECYGLKGRRNSCGCIIAAEGLQYQIKLNFLATVAGNRHLSTYKKRIQFPFYFFPRMPI